MLKEEKVEVSDHLFEMVRIVFEFTDVLQKLLAAGATTEKDFLIFEHKECSEVYAVNPINQTILSLNTIYTPTRFGAEVDDVEEIICLIERFVSFVIESLGQNFPQKEIFMEKFNPKKYKAGSCFTSN